MTTKNQDSKIAIIGTIAAIAAIVYMVYKGKKIPVIGSLTPGAASGSTPSPGSNPWSGATGGFGYGLSSPMLAPELSGSTGFAPLQTQYAMANASKNVKSDLFPLFGFPATTNTTAAIAQLEQMLMRMNLAYQGFSSSAVGIGPTRTFWTTG